MENKENKKINVNLQNLKEIRQIDPRLASYNIEMAEVTGGTFWKPYSLEQLAGKADFSNFKGLQDMSSMMEYFPPIDLYTPRLRKLARDLGPAWIRVSGSWATKTYFDVDGHTNGRAPEGYDSVLTVDEWKGVLDFVKAVDGKLLISVTNCDGNHTANEPWNPDQAKALFDFSKNYGVPIAAAEFMNEPNMLSFSGAPQGYTEKDFARDQDLFFNFIKENYPETLTVGPSSMIRDQLGNAVNLLPVPFLNPRDLMKGTKVAPDVLSYHCYNGISQRMASIGGGWTADQALKPVYLNIPKNCALEFASLRDQYCPGAPMWVTESADAGGGGSVWASTYLDIFRTLIALGSFAKVTDGVIFHNTLASSDYGLLDHRTFAPRPNYFAFLLWNRFMGTTVYATDSLKDDDYVFIHYRRDGKRGLTYLVLNPSRDKTLSLDLPGDAEEYRLSADSMISPVMKVNGMPLQLTDDDQLPEIHPVFRKKGEVTLEPLTAAFFVMEF